MARAEGATLEPIYLPTVSMQLPLETPLPRQCEQASTVTLLISIKAFRRFSHLFAERA